MPPPSPLTPSGGGLGGGSSNLGRSLYRRILRELRATRNYDHHLRDIRFLLWVPGTQGKRKFDALKQLAEKSQSLHPRRAKRTSAAASASDAVAAAAAAVVVPATAAAAAGATPEPKNANPTIADQIRAVARELFNHHARMHQKIVAASAPLPPPSSSPPVSGSAAAPLITPEQVKQRAAAAAKRARLLQEGTARAFWAIKRLQDIRQSAVPTASMWLTGPQRARFDPFTSLRDTHFRSGAFPFLPEFLGVDENLVLASPEEEEDAVIAEAVDDVPTWSRCSSKTLRLEVVSRCAAAQGTAAPRYHLSFRVENMARDAAVDIKLAHLFAVNCEAASAPVLTEMVCSLPLLGNSILRPTPDASVAYSFTADEDEEEEEDDDEEAAVDDEQVGGRSGDAAKSRGGNVPGQDPDDEEDDHEDGDGNIQSPATAPSPHVAAVGDDEETRPEGKSPSSPPSLDLLQQKLRAAAAASASTTTASLPPQAEQLQHRRRRDNFTAKSNTPEHCAVYDVTFPVQGECVLRGVVFYRVISNTVPAASLLPPCAGGKAPPTVVKSRLKALHFPPIRLTSRAEDEDE